jgi:DNA polymerase-1
MSTAAGTKKPSAPASGTIPPARRLLLLDGHSLAYRAFFALPAENFRTGTGADHQRGLRVHLDAHQPAPRRGAHAPRGGLRRVPQDLPLEKFVEYKANRSSTPDDFRGQVDLIKEVLKALAIPFFGVEGFEADDVIATLTAQAEADGFQVAITTGDRDAFQLVSDNVMVLYPTRGVSELGRIDPAAVKERYGLTPEQYPRLRGAARRPQRQPAQHPRRRGEDGGQVGARVRLARRAHRPRRRGQGQGGRRPARPPGQRLLNRQLTELVRDVPLDVRPADLEVRPWDRDAVHRLFDELEFRVLRERLFSTLTSAEPEAEGGIEVQGGAIAPGGVRAWLDEHARDGRRVGLAFHGLTGGAVGADLAGIGLAAGEPTVEARAGGATAGVPQAAYVDVTTARARRRGRAGGVAGRPGRPQGRARRQGGPARAARAGLDAGRAHQRHPALLPTSPGPASAASTSPTSPCDTCAASCASTARTTAGSSPCWAGRRRPTPRGRPRRWSRPSAVAELADALDVELAEKAASRLLAELELPLEFVLADLETAGIAVDPRPALRAGGRVRRAGHAGRAGRVLRHRQGDQPRLAQAAAGRAVRRAGHAQDQAHQDRLHHRRRGLVDLFAKSPHPFLESLLRHRDVSRLRQTVEGLLKTVADDGRIHTTYNQTIAATGRLSSTDPNLQNIPIRTEEGRQIREAFVVGPKGECLLTADYSQIEMRIMAHLSW